MTIGDPPLSKESSLGKGKIVASWRVDPWDKIKAFEKAKWEEAREHEIFKSSLHQQLFFASYFFSAIIFLPNILGLKFLTRRTSWFGNSTSRHYTNFVIILIFKKRPIIYKLWLLGKPKLPTIIFFNEKSSNICCRSVSRACSIADRTP